MECSNMYRRISPVLVVPLLVTAVALCACGPRVSRIALDDQRLPLEARRWLADAEDEVSIASASHDEARNRLDEAREFRNYVNSDVNPNWPNNAQASQAESRLERLVQERIRLAQLGVDAAEARIVLAQALLVRARAETAVRHDIAAYDLEPIVEGADDARGDVNEYASRLEQQRIAVDEATTQFWEAYGAYLQGGGANTVLWSWEPQTPE
jgi:hypothetical protein